MEPRKGALPQGMISRRDFLRTAAGTAAGAAIARVLGQTLPAGQAPDRPNILFILADDLGWEALGCCGGTSYKTPNLDALAKTGTRFQHCYCNPLCSPTRVELMTGLYNFRNYRGWGVLNPKEVRTFAHILKDAGYATGIAGKWQFDDFRKHPDHVKDCGFDEYCMWTWQLDGKRTPRYWKPSVWQAGKLREDVAAKYGPDVFRDFLIDFITTHKSKPFFAYYPMVLVHDPHEPTPDSPKGARKGKAAGKAGAKATKPAGAEGEEEGGAVSAGGGIFADMVAYMDKEVGKLVSALDRLGLREKTLILFTGDNGTAKGIPSKVGDKVVRGGKGSMLDTGSHVPLIANWKGTAPEGKVSQDLIDFSDMMPTFLELAGAKPPQGVTIDGRSFLPQLRGQAGKPREWIYVQLNNKHFIQDARWKLSGDGNLYDISNAPFEEKLIEGSSDAEAAAAKKRLGEALAKLRQG